MSVQVPLNIFSYSEKQILLQNLTVIAQEKESKSVSKKSKPNPYKKDTTLYGFEIITKNNIEYILLPFFYCYNFLSNKLNSLFCKLFIMLYLRFAFALKNELIIIRPKS